MGSVKMKAHVFLLIGLAFIALTSTSPIPKKNHRNKKAAKKDTKVKKDAARGIVRIGCTDGQCPGPNQATISTNRVEGAGQIVGEVIHPIQPAGPQGYPITFTVNSVYTPAGANPGNLALLPPAKITPTLPPVTPAAANAPLANASAPGALTGAAPAAPLTPPAAPALPPVPPPAAVPPPPAAPSAADAPVTQTPASAVTPSPNPVDGAAAPPAAQAAAPAPAAGSPPPPEPAANAAPTDAFAQSLAEKLSNTSNNAIPSVGAAEATPAAPSNTSSAPGVMPAESAAPELPQYDAISNKPNTEFAETGKMPEPAPSAPAAQPQTGSYDETQLGQKAKARGHKVKGKKQVKKTKKAKKAKSKKSK